MASSLVAALAGTSALMAPMVASAPAFAAPGNPGVPADPDVVYVEDFENVEGDITTLGEYTSSTGITYTADPYWLSAVNCNGFIINRLSEQLPEYCENRANEWDSLTAKIGPLAELRGGNPDTNHALATNTTSGTADPNANIMFRTAENVPIDGSGRFLSLSASFAASSFTCRGNASPILDFTFVDENGNEQNVSDEPINIYADERGTEFIVPTDSGNRCIVAGDFASDSSILFDGSSLGLIMRNLSTATSTGNDGAIDNVSILDATPQLDKEFSDELVRAGDSTTLTFTVTNTSELSSKVGWGFTDNLPEGMLVADPASIGGSCEVESVSAEAGSSSIAVTGGTIGTDEVSCTITVDVTSEEPIGSTPSPVTYINNADNIDDLIGLNPPGEATVDFFNDTDLSLEKSSNATVDSRPGDEIEYTVTATNNGELDYTAENPAVIFDDLSEVLDDAIYNDDAAASREGTLSYAEPLVSWVGELPAGESVTISYTVTLQSGGDGQVRNVAWEPADPDNPVPPVCDGDDTTDPATGELCATTEFDLPKLEITKAADRTDLPAVGEETQFTITLTNPGPGEYSSDAPATMTDDLSDVLDDADLVTGSLAATSGEVSVADGVINWSGPLAANESVEITYSVVYTGAGDQILYNLACVPDDEVAQGGDPCATVTIPGSGLEQSKSVAASDNPVVAGSELTYTLRFANTGPATAAVDSIDDLRHVLDDADVTIEPAAGVGDLTATRDGSVIFIGGDVPTGEVYTVVYTVTVKPDGERGDDIAANFLLENTDEPEVPEQPVCEPTDPNSPTCTSTPIGAIDYSKDVSAADDPLGAGSELTYTITINNTGQTVMPVSREDVLDDVLDDASLTVAPTANVDTITVSEVEGNRFQIGGTLAAGQTALVTYVVTINEEGERGNNELNNFIVPPGETPPGECVTGSTECTSTPVPEISPTKTASPDSGTAVNGGDEVTYTLRFENVGAATGAIDYTDFLTGVFDDADLADGPTSSSSNVIASIEEDTLQIGGTLTAGEVVTITYTVLVKADGERGDNQLANFLIPSDEGTPPSECEVDSSTCTTHPVGELSTWKSVDPASNATVREGDELTYTLHFENTGNAPVAVDREDVVSGVLDDADIVSAPTASADSLTVSEIVDGRFSITGELAAGARETVTYTVQVKATEDRGDDRLANFLVPNGEEPPEVCEPVEGQLPNCTVNPVSDIQVSKLSDPESGTEVKPGEDVTYTLTFTNRSQNPDAAATDVDYTDHMVDVLDDADLAAGPTASDASLTATMTGDQIRIVGAIASGETVTVTYTVTVKDYADHGNGSLGNVVAQTGDAPVCAPNSDLCTEHPTPEPPGGDGNDPSNESGNDLPVTGGELSWMLAGLAALLLTAGGVLMIRRKNAVINQ